MRELDVFVAPVVPGRLVRLTRWGHRHEMLLDGGPVEGWFWLQASSPETACVLDPARPVDRRDYLESLPLQHALLLWPLAGTSTWMAMLESDPGRAAPVYLVRGGRALERVRVRRDCGQLWHDAPDRTRPPRARRFLEGALAHDLLPGWLHDASLTPADRQAYALLRRRVHETRELSVQVRVRDALAHAGARLVRVAESPAGLRVVWEKGGGTHQATIDADLQVVTAGICLSGRDQAFDLTSLVTVFEEARRKGVAA